MKKLTEEQKNQYIRILNYVIEEYPNDKEHTWFEISSEWFMENGHDIDDEEIIGVVFDEIMKKQIINNIGNK